jgi:hypothetical protein
MIIAMRIKMQGFLVFDFAEKYPTARKELAQWLSEGKIQRKETIIKGGLAAAEKALVDLYNGINTGTVSSFRYTGSFVGCANSKQANCWLRLRLMTEEQGQGCRLRRRVRRTEKYEIIQLNMRGK